MLAKKTVKKNQITLPKKIVEQMPDTDYFEVSLQGYGILLRPVRLEGSADRLAQVRRKIKALGLTEKEIDRPRSSFRETRRSFH
jgi:hypothetical protein